MPIMRQPLPKVSEPALRKKNRSFPRTEAVGPVASSSAAGATASAAAPGGRCRNRFPYASTPTTPAPMKSSATSVLRTTVTARHTA
jgi:hypothetical protein